MSTATNLCNSIDCGRTTNEAPALAKVPAIDLLAKDYDSLLRAMLDLLPSRAPGWSDRTEADLGMALLELFAYAGDQLSYLQDRVALEGYLRTATQYESVRKHLRLIDYTLDPGCAASVDVIVEATGATPLYLPAGFQVSTLGVTVAATAAVTNTQPIDPVVFETTSDAIIVPGLSRMALASDAPSNAAGDQIVLASIDTTLLTTGSRLLLESGVTREWATVATSSIGATTTTITLTKPLANRFAHSGSAAAQVYGNVIAATHGQSVATTVEGTGEAAQRIALEFAPLTYVTGADGARVSTLTVTVDGDAFHEVEDFVSSTAADDHYRITRDNEGYITVHFGDGSQGRVPPLGATIEVAYRVGIGEAGLVAADALTEFTSPTFADPTQSILAVRNPFASSGATEPESIARAKAFAPRQLSEQHRAVTEADFEAFVLQGVEVNGKRIVPVQAKARFQFTGSWLTTMVSIDLPDRTPLRATPALRKAFESLLTRYKMIGTDVRVEDARYAPVSIGLVIEVLPEYFARDVRGAVELVLSGNAATGFFAPGRFGFGQKLHLSDLYSTVMAVEGVRSVAVSRFKRLGDRYADAEAQGYIEVGALEIIRCDNDPEHTDNGALFIRTCGGKDG